MDRIGSSSNSFDSWTPSVSSSPDTSAAAPADSTSDSSAPSAPTDQVQLSGAHDREDGAPSSLLGGLGDAYGTKMVDWDNFDPKHPDQPGPHGPIPHGEGTAAAARGQVPDVDVVKKQGTDGNGGLDPERQARVDQAADATRDADPTLQAFKQGAVRSAAGTLEAGSQALQKTSAYHDGATNLSFGATKIDNTMDEWAKIRGAWDPRAQQDHATGKPVTREEDHARGVALAQAYAKDFHIDPKDLIKSPAEGQKPDSQMSPDELQRAYAARTALANGLTQAQGSAIEASPEVQAARGQFASDAAAAEARRQNVVVAAGNGGIKLEQYRGDFGGQTPSSLVTPDAAHSELSNDHTTTVGVYGADSNRGMGPGREQDPNWAGNLGNAQVYADGFADKGHASGAATSDATPKVTAALWQIHRDHPGIGSDDALKLLLDPKNGYTSSGVGPGGAAVPVLAAPTWR